MDEIRLKEIRERLDGYSVVLKKDMMFLLAALQEAQSIINTTREELTQNCIFYKYGTEYRNCSHAHCNCQMYRTCKAIQGGKYGQTGNN